MACRAALILLVACLYAMHGFHAYPSKTCETMHCLRHEVCAMEQGSCDNWGRCQKYPVCRSPSTNSYGSCDGIRCPAGQFCSLIQDRCTWKPCPSRPTCVSSNSTGIRGGYTRRPW